MTKIISAVFFFFILGCAHVSSSTDPQRAPTSLSSEVDGTYWAVNFQLRGAAFEFVDRELHIFLSEEPVTRDVTGKCNAKLNSDRKSTQVILYLEKTGTGYDLTGISLFGYRKWEQDLDLKTTLAEQKTLEDFKLDLNLGIATGKVSASASNPQGTSLTGTFQATYCPGGIVQ